MNITKIGLIILGIVVWVAPIVAAYLFQEPKVLLAWLLSYAVTDEIIDSLKRP